MDSRFKYFLFLFFIMSCGQGVDQIAHIGICDGYSSWQSSEYILPYTSGTTQEVSQGNCSAVSHFGAQRFAYDFSMPINTSIVASRAGTVLNIQEGFEDGNGCPDDNHIEVLHADGTVATYVHLTKDGVLVSKGANVTQGQEIARSGNTGCSSGAHLHFVVWSNQEKKDSIPINFRNTSANPIGLQDGKEYSAD